MRFRTATIYANADTRSRALIRRFAFMVCLLIAGIAAVLSVVSILQGYFQIDFFTILLLSVLAVPAALLIRAERVTAGGIFLVSAVQLVIGIEPYLILRDPVALATYLTPNCVGLAVNILIAALFVGRIAVVVLTAISCGDVVLIAFLGSSPDVRENVAYIVIAMVAAGFLASLLTSLFSSALASAREEGRRNAELQEQLLHAQKMEAIGRLAGGIAHDFNNILHAASAQTEVMLLDGALSAPARQQVKEIRGYIDRGSGLTRQLLVFSRRQPVAQSVFDAREALGNLESMLGRIVQRDVRLALPTGKEPAKIQADPRQFEQVVMNLVVNARDAMPAGGSIELLLDRVDAGAAGLSARPPLKPGPYVSLAVRDTGTGMTPDVMSHLFEPFFTTKPEGQGTGLGLSTVYAIVSRWGGGVTVSSVPDCGSTFVVYFPAA